MGQVQSEQRNLTQLLVPHTLDHIQVMLVHQLWLRLFIFLDWAHIDAAFLAPKEWKWILWNRVFLFPTVLFFDGYFVVGLVGFFYFYTQNNGRFDLAFVDAPIASGRIALLKCRAVMRPTTLSDVHQFQVNLCRVVVWILI